MPIGILTGFAIPTLAHAADHTYVTSSDGHQWGCWGRSKGGRPICSGTGNTLKADCLSHGASEAGITYGMDGFCHQMANRILCPAGITVVEARGYRVSFFMWGAYGRERKTRRHYDPILFPWPELARCNQGHLHP